MSQESSLLALNSMYQVRDCLSLLSECDGGPVIYEDKDSDEEEGEGTELAMETDEEADESADGVNDFEDMSDWEDLLQTEESFDLCEADWLLDVMLYRLDFCIEKEFMFS